VMLPASMAPWRCHKASYIREIHRKLAHQMRLLPR